VFSFTILSKDIENQIQALIDGDNVVAEIYNDAKSPDGTFYWRILNDGRGPVRPVNKKVLHWIDPKTGRDVFSTYSGPVAPRHIRENSIPAIQQAVIPGDWTTKPLNRDTLKEFVNAVAVVAVNEMQSRTPVITGTLRDSYRIDEKT